MTTFKPNPIKYKPHYCEVYKSFISCWSPPSQASSPIDPITTPRLVSWGGPPPAPELPSVNTGWLCPCHLPETTWGQHWIYYLLQPRRPQARRTWCIPFRGCQEESVTVVWAGVMWPERGQENKGVWVGCCQKMGSLHSWVSVFVQGVGRWSRTRARTSREVAVTSLEEERMWSCLCLCFAYSSYLYLCSDMITEGPWFCLIPPWLLNGFFWCWFLWNDLGSPCPVH